MTKTILKDNGFCDETDPTKQVSFDVSGLATGVIAMVYWGSGAPSASAAKGSLYIRTDGSSTSTRMYINTDGATTWTNVTTAA